MHILFIAKGDFPDYQSDAVFHGGRSLLGSNFVDCNKVWYMYKEDKDLYWKKRIPGKDYGNGFTFPGTFDVDDIDRTNIESKISSHFFDKIIYGSVTRCRDYLSLVLMHYDRGDILFIDGEDDSEIRQDLIELPVTYYKRELRNLGGLHLKPISFAIPKELILNNVAVKTKDYASLIPGDLSTYTFDTQESYYQEYQQSISALTHRKGGWDCMRHYEIIANSCIPYFPGLHECPVGTMHTFPKKIVNDFQRLVLEASTQEGLHVNTLEVIANHLLEYAKINLTTEALFKYILNNKQELKSTYIFICNYNRLQTTKKLVELLNAKGYFNIVILDNGSSYQPLLDWYATLYTTKVHFCKNNYGPEAIDQVRNYEPEFQNKYNHIVLNEYHVYTDSDVIPVEDIPDTFIDDMVRLCKIYEIPKLGLSLKIDDLPDHYPLKDRVVRHESSFFEREYIDDTLARLFKAPVDTTFAVNAPGMPCGYSDLAYRVAGKYFARHEPWYLNPSDLPADESYYLSTIQGPRPHWSNILKDLINNNQC
jgi:hypothetical protein